jgi:pimeloyl-ACP methyl ester carboxylesterase
MSPKRSRVALTSVLLFAFLGLAGCGAPPSDRSEPANAADATEEATPGELSPGEHVWTAADGASLPYEVAGEGDVTVLLIHCWMCDRSFWAEQIPALAGRYRTIALDLPGHGEASRDRAEWTVEGYGQDVAGLIETLGLEEVVLVGHSMGGPVALRTAALSDGAVRGIVAVDTLHDAEPDFSSGEFQRMIEAMEADFGATCSRFVEQMFSEEDAAEVARRVQATSCDPARAPVGVALMKSYATIDLPAWFADAGVPIRAINAAQPHRTEVERNRRYADFDVTLMEGVGHYPHMTRPEQFNPLLLDAIDEILAM